ncbi:DUF222 domain-containing protein, partial [Pseudoclavibacter helvolus]|uniref:HNH endonuclease signature motif containing protein n=1 Tax=Pseudoclavibacter helvolus TaxID=255205 RepID=UPI003C77D662
HTRNRVEVEDVARAEAELVASACGLDPEDEQPATPKALEVQTALWVSYLDPDGDEPRADKIAAERGLWWSRRSDGAVTGKFVATAEQGDQLISVLDAHLSPRRAVEFPAAAAEATVTGCGEPLAPALGANSDSGAWGDGSTGNDADADVDVDWSGTGSDRLIVDGDTNVRDGSTESDHPLEDTRTTPQRRIDALASVLAGYAESPNAPRIGGEAPTLVVVTTDAGIAGGATRPEDVPHLEHTGEPVPASFAAKLLCDGFVRVARQAPNGEILDLGRRRRLFTTAQRRAIFTRDKHCRAPGCRAPVRWCETHHAQPWSEGGPTDVDHGILLCSFHHHEVHRGHLNVTHGPDGRWHVHATPPHYVRRRAPRRRTTTRRGTPVPRPEQNRRL